MAFFIHVENVLLLVNRAHRSYVKVSKNLNVVKRVVVSHKGGYRAEFKGKYLLINKLFN